MTEFRYAQFCPIARATELLGERWTLLIIRELLLGPQRFSDLRRRLPGLSTSVLSARIRRLEERGVVTRRTLAPPAASSVVELTALGEALRPVAIELTRWGLQLMHAPQPGDHIEPSWLRMGLPVLANPDPTPQRRYEIALPEEGGDIVLYVRGGPEGTRVSDLPEDPDSPPDARVRAHPMQIFALLAGALDGRQAAIKGEIELSGDPDSLVDLPALFTLVDLPLVRGPGGDTDARDDTTDRQPAPSPQADPPPQARPNSGAAD